jgi:E3 ubiquitin-protein ligase RNF38/44
VVKALQALPTDSIFTAAELQQQTAHQLKQRLMAAGARCDGCLEKQELVAKLLEIGGSSASSCSICCEEYSSGDVVRVLPCKHRYHIECIDRWFLSSIDYSRAPACPMCNAELQLQ